MRDSIKVNTDDYNFKFRVSGIIKKDNKVLMVSMDDSDFLCLPGGYVELGEKTEIALLRELEEETGYKFKIKNYIGVIENFFINKYNKKIHEISFYYLADPINEMNYNNYTRIENDKGHLIKLNFEWININEIDKYNIKPSILKIILKDDEYNLHYVINELE